MIEAFILEGRRAAVLAVALALGIGACGDDNNTSTSVGPSEIGRAHV